MRVQQRAVELARTPLRTHFDVRGGCKSRPSSLRGDLASLAMANPTCIVR